MLLVKRPGAVPEAATIHYCDIGDHLSREQKLQILGRPQLDEIEWAKIEPNRQGDWTNQRSDEYLSLRPVAVIQSEKSMPSQTPFFQDSQLGVVTSRDAWIYNSSMQKLRELVERQVSFYNRQVDALKGTAETVTHDSKQFKWDNTSERRAKSGRRAEVNPLGFRSAIYRPFFRQGFYMDKVLNVHHPAFFPTPDTLNPSILVERGLRALGRPPAVIAVNTTPDIAIGAGASGLACQLLPRYAYSEPEDPKQGELLPAAPHRYDNIAGEILDAYRELYGESVTGDDIFAYVYGVLHSPEYRERYASDLAMMLPRIPEVATAEGFRGFSEAGQRLLDLHIGYEDAERYGLHEALKAGAPEGAERYRVQKMGWAGTAHARDKSAIVVNDWITLRGIPEQAHEYLVGPRSALEWLIDRYQVRTDKDSGVVNDPNDWGLEFGNPRYIVDLVKRIATVSVETMKIVSALPTLETA